MPRSGRKFRIAAALLLVAGLAGVLGAIFGGWVAVIGAVVAGAIAIAVEAVEHRHGRKREVAEVIGSPPGRVADVDPFGEQVGVFPSSAADRYGARDREPPYVPRAVDAALRYALRRQGSTAVVRQLVLVRGPSLSGKSRTAFEILRQVHGSKRLVVPNCEAGRCPSWERIAESIAAAHGGTEPVVLWLDRLERFVDDHSPLDVDAWGRLRGLRPPVIVLSTISDADFEALPTATRSFLEGGIALGDVLELSVSRGLSTPEEQAAATSLYPDEDPGSLARWLGGHFAGVDLLLDKWRHGARTAPEGAALMAGVIDWHRIGLSRPIPESDLETLFRLYLGDREPHRDATSTAFADALRWALDRVPGGHSLLVSEDLDDGRPAYRGSEVLLASQVADHGRPPYVLTGEAWSTVRDLISPSEALDIAYRLFDAGDPVAARRALVRAAESDDADTSDSADLMLGSELLEAGYLDAAETLLKRAATPESEVGDLARARLGALAIDRALRATEGKQLIAGLARADAALRDASRSDDAEARGTALHQLGRLETLRANRTQGEDAARHFARAVQVLEELLAEADDEWRAFATAAYVHTITVKHSDTSGARPEAEADFTRALELLDAVGADEPTCWYARAMLLAEWGLRLGGSRREDYLDEAEEYFAREIRDGSKVILAATNLATLLSARNRWPLRMKALYAYVVRNGNPTDARIAAYNLASHLADGDPDPSFDVDELLAFAVESERPSVRLRAQILQAALMSDERRAVDRLRQLEAAALSTGDEHAADIAASYLDQLDG